MIRDNALREIEEAGFDSDDAEVLINIIDQFFGQWDSGGAVSVMIPVLNRLLCGVPLTPLTGDDDEWIDVNSFNKYTTPGTHYMNRRYTRLQKKIRDDGSFAVFDVDRPGPIVFPYDPVAQAPDPVITLNI